MSEHREEWRIVGASGRTYESYFTSAPDEAVLADYDHDVPGQAPHRAQYRWIRTGDWEDAE